METNAGQSPIMDHIVVLVPHQTLLELSEKLKDFFVVIKGGEHADGLTHNYLILLEDGVYIELMAFYDHIDPEVRKRHHWGQLPEGTIIDWAYTLPDEAGYPAVQKRVREADTGFVYADLVGGGRVKPDGTILKWAVASGKKQESGQELPGTLPFWCLDRTPRENRVPYQGNPQTKHPSGVTGISGLLIAVPEADLPGISRTYEAVHAGGEVGGKGKGLHFDVPSGSTVARQLIELTAKQVPGGIRLKLWGTKDSPSEVEILPGIIFEIEK